MVALVQYDTMVLVLVCRAPQTRPSVVGLPCHLRLIVIFSSSSPPF